MRITVQSKWYLSICPGQSGAVPTRCKELAAVEVPERKGWNAGKGQSNETIMA